MKKFLLFSVAVALSASVFAQSGYKALKHPDANKSVKTTLINHNEAAVAEMSFTPDNNIVQVTQNRSSNGVTDAVIMTTQYDLQSNACLSNRMIAWPDGNVAAVATWGVATAPSFPDRGAGYNFYNGSSWGTQPTARVESVRSGWPSITQLGANGELLVSHGGSPTGVRVYTRETKGTGSWTEKGEIPNYPSGITMTWPRVVTTGEDNNFIHVMAAYQDASNTAINKVYYNRSEDGGNTWQQWAYPPEVDVEYYNYNIGADDYALAANGNNIAILFNSAWYDMFIIKSTDNGETWEKKMIWEHPYPSFDFNTTLTTDTLWTTDNSANIAIDDNGMVHVVWATMRVMHSDVGTSYNYFPYTDGIGYWNESMGEIPTNPTNPHKTLDPDYLESLGMGMVVGWVPDINGNGQIDIESTSSLLAYRTLGLSTMPSIAIDNNGTIGIFYSTIDETRFDPEGVYHMRNMFASYKDGVYGSWYLAYENITSGIFHLFEEIYSTTCASKGYNGTFWAMYSADQGVGLAVDEDHDYWENKIYAAKITPVIVGINELTNPVTDISAVYPNPVSGEMKIDVNLSKNVKNAEVAVSTITGQRVYQAGINNLGIGVNTVVVPTQKFNAGIYFCTITIDGNKETRKFVVK